MIRCDSNARRSLLMIAVMFFAGLVFLSPRALAKKDKSPSAQGDPYAPLRKAPEKAVARPNPLEHDPEATRAGRKLFALHCAECHGDMAEGSKKAPSLLAPEVQNTSAGALFWLLSNGVVRRGMPVWSKLPDAQRWQLVSFIKSLKLAPDAAKPPVPESQPTHP